MRNRFQTANVILRFLGTLLIGLGIILIAPLIVVILNGEIAQGTNTLIAFLVPSIISFILGILLRIVFQRGSIRGFQAMLICSLGWIGFSAIGAIPFAIGINVSYLDAYFETMSGFTTTGITMFTGLEQMPQSILFWRSLTQWLGGLGILTFFLAVIFRGGVGHRLFGAESHKIDTGRLVPGLANTVKILWSIYFGFTLFIFLSLLLAGMPLFDCICHSFTSVSTGGFSPHDASIEYYRLSGYPHFIWIEYILIVGMLLGGTNFLIHYRVLKREGRALIDNTEMRYWWALIIIFITIIFIERFIKLSSFHELALNTKGFWIKVEENFRIILFQVVAILTTTGFGTRDIGGAFFGYAAKQLFLVMMFIGGCVGSTSGGFKVLRISILFKLIKREIFNIRTPRRSIAKIFIDGKAIESNEIYRVSSLFFTWVFLLIIGGCTTALLSDFDSYSSFSGMFSALGNIGPCYIPVKAMGQLHPAIKIIYIFGMLAGRLEILPVLLLFSPKAWQT
jgi:trk system potassium uptake protein TrkH